MKKFYLIIFALIVLTAGCSIDSAKKSETIELETLTFDELINKASAPVPEIVKITSGGSHSFVLLSNGELYGTGSNMYGQLGLDSYGYITEWTIVFTDVKDIETGPYHSLAITTDNYAYATGYNRYGQLGGSISDDSLFGWEQATKNNNVVEVSCGSLHSMTLRNDGRVLVAGRNYDGQLGIGNYKDSKKWKESTTNAVKISAGKDHSLVIKPDNNQVYQVYAVGSNANGQLGVGDSILKINDWDKSTNGSVNTVDIKASVFHSMLLKENGNVRICGSPMPNVEIYNWEKVYEDAQSIDAGSAVSLIKSDSRAYILGYLGSSEYSTWTDLEVSNVNLIAAGWWAAMICQMNGDLNVKGFNYYGQLGVGLDYNDEDYNIPDWVIANDYIFD